MQTLRNVRGDGVRVATGSSRIWRVRDIDNGIEGAGGMTAVALWYWFAHAAEAVSEFALGVVTHRWQKGSIANTIHAVMTKDADSGQRHEPPRPVHEGAQRQAEQSPLNPPAPSKYASVPLSSLDAQSVAISSPATHEPAADGEWTGNSSSNATPVATGG
jgi:hypothetical protein